MNPLEELLTLIRERAESLNDETRDLAEAVTRDSAQLWLRKLQGEDVDEELAHVLAQARNLSVVALGLVRQTIGEWVYTQLSRFVQRLMM